MGRKPRAAMASPRDPRRLVAALALLALLAVARAQTTPCSTFPVFGTGELDITTDFIDEFVSPGCRGGTGRVRASGTLFAPPYSLSSRRLHPPAPARRGTRCSAQTQTTSCRCVRPAQLVAAQALSARPAGAAAGMRMCPFACPAAGASHAAPAPSTRPTPPPRHPRCVPACRSPLPSSCPPASPLQLTAVCSMRGSGASLDPTFWATTVYACPGAPCDPTENVDAG